LPLVFRHYCEDWEITEKLKGNHDEYLDSMFRHGEGPKARSQVVKYSKLTSDKTRGNKFIQGVGQGINYTTIEID